MEQPISPAVPAHFVNVPSYFFFIRCAQIGLAVVMFALDAYVLSRFNGYFGGAPASTMFLTLITMLYCGYYIAATRFAPTIYQPIPMIAAEVLLTIWWLGNWTGSAYLASVWNGLGYYGYLYGSLDNLGPSIGAIAGLGALEWLLFLATMILFITARTRQTRASAPGNGMGSKLEHGYVMQTQPPPASVPQASYVADGRPPGAHPIVPQQPPYPTGAPTQAYYPSDAGQAELRHT